MDWYSDVFDLVFPGVKAEEVNQLWKKELRRPSKEEREAEERDSGFESD